MVRSLFDHLSQVPSVPRIVESYRATYLERWSGMDTNNSQQSPFQIRKLGNSMSVTTTRKLRCNSMSVTTTPNGTAPATTEPDKPFAIRLGYLPTELSGLVNALVIACMHDDQLRPLFQNHDEVLLDDDEKTYLLIRERLAAAAVREHESMDVVM
jgi:hypothetical protein